MNHTKNIEIKFIEKWPFNINLISEGNVIFSFDRIAYSTVQKTIEECENAIGFRDEEKQEIIKLLENQKADIKLFSCAPEMLEVLISIADGNCNSCNHENYKQCDNFCGLKETRLIIEKATGLKIEEVLL